MKTRSLVCCLLQFLAFLLFSLSVQAVSVPPLDVARDPLVLIAEKNGRTKFYALGESVRIEYENNDRKIRVKGYITHISQDSVEISQFGRNLVTTAVDTRSIVSVTKLKRKQRKTIGILAGALVLALGILTIISKGTLFTNSWAFAVIAIPGIAAGYGLLIFLGISYLSQILNKCSAKHGWRFYSGIRPSRSTWFK